MNDQLEPPSEHEPIPPGDPTPKPPPKIVWLVVAFIPSLAALATLQKDSGPGTLQFLFALDVICSLVAGFGMMSGKPLKASRVVLAIFLTGFFFVVNVVISVLIGCSHMPI